MHIHMLLDHYAYVHDVLMYDAYIHDPWYLTMLRVCMMRQILFRTDERTNEQGDSRSRKLQDFFSELHLRCCLWFDATFIADTTFKGNLNQLCWKKYAILPKGLTLMRISSLWFGFWCRSVYDICTWSAPIWKVDAIYISSMIYWYMMRPNNIEIQITKKNFLFNFMLLYSDMIYARSERVHMSTQHWTLATLLFEHSSDFLKFVCFEFRDLLAISSKDFLHVFKLPIYIVVVVWSITSMDNKDLDLDLGSKWWDL